MDKTADPVYDTSIDPDRPLDQDAYSERDDPVRIDVQGQTVEVDSRAENAGDPDEPVCANCGGAIAVDDLICPHCGISMVSG